MKLCFLENMEWSYRYVGTHICIDLMMQNIHCNTRFKVLFSLDPWCAMFCRIDPLGANLPTSEKLEYAGRTPCTLGVLAHS